LLYFPTFNAQILPTREVLISRSSIHNSNLDDLFEPFVDGWWLDSRMNISHVPLWHHFVRRAAGVAGDADLKRVLEENVNDDQQVRLCRRHDRPACSDLDHDRVENDRVAELGVHGLRPCTFP